MWIGQALLMTVAVRGVGTTDELAQRIRTGDVGIDLHRPVNVPGRYLAADPGRATYHVLAGGLGPTVVGWLSLDIRHPGSLLAGLVPW